jgi:hypothetical protein
MNNPSGADNVLAAAVAEDTAPAAGMKGAQASNPIPRESTLEGSFPAPVESMAFLVAGRRLGI